MKGYLYVELVLSSRPIQQPIKVKGERATSRPDTSSRQSRILLHESTTPITWSCQTTSVCLAVSFAFDVQLDGHCATRALLPGVPARLFLLSKSSINDTKRRQAYSSQTTAHTHTQQMFLGLHTGAYAFVQRRSRRSSRSFFPQRESGLSQNSCVDYASFPESEVATN